MMLHRSPKICEFGLIRLAVFRFGASAHVIGHLHLRHHFFVGESGGGIVCWFSSFSQVSLIVFSEVISSLPWIVVAVDEDMVAIQFQLFTVSAVVETVVTCFS